MILLSFPDEEGYSDKQSQQLCSGNGQPDSVDAEKERKYKYNSKLEYQCPQEGDNCGDQSVVQCRKEGRTENIKAAQKEGNRIKAKSSHSHGIKLCIIADKKPRKHAGKQHTYRTQHNACPQKQLP